MIAGSLLAKDGVARKRLVELAIGLSVNQAMVYVFDYLCYPFAIYRLGMFAGGVLMALFSLLVCLGSLWVYDLSKRDWLGIEAIRQIKQYEGGNRFTSFLARLMRRGDPVALLVLSIKFDPFITMLYMRKQNRTFATMAWSDWQMFMTSWVISNAYWIAICYLGVSVIT